MPEPDTRSISLTSEVVTTEAGFDGLEATWTRLHRESGAGVFQSFEWARTWWTHVGRRNPDRALRILVLRAGDEAVCIAPLFIDPVVCLPGIPLRRLAFLGTGLTDHLDILVARGQEAVCADRVATELAGRDDFDAIELSDIADGSPTHTVLHAALQAHGFEGERFVNENCPRTRLAATWKETLASWDGNHRRQIAKRTRQLNEHYKVELDICSRAEDVRRDIDAFIDLHQYRWTSAGHQGVYNAPYLVEFQREVARVFFDRGWLFLAFLRLDGERMATICGFAYGKELAYYLNGVAELGEARKYSPGTVLHGLCMEALIGRGIEVYDFLRGTERYKYELGAVDVPNWTLRMSQAGARVPRLKQSVAAFNEGIARRYQREKAAFNHHRSTHNFRETLRYTTDRIRATVGDAVKRMKGPA